MFFGLSEKIKKSISLRLALLFSVTFSVCLTVALVFTYFQVSFSLKKADHEVISAKWREIATVSSHDGIASLKSFLLSDSNRVKNSPFMVRMLNAKGETLFFKPSTQEEDFDFEKILKKYSTPSSMLGWSQTGAISDEDTFDIFTDTVAEGLFLQVGKSSEDREDVLEKLVFAFLTVTLTLILLSGAFGIWYARKSLAPIKALTETILSIEKGDLSQRVSSGTQNELMDLGLTFNRMIDRIERLIRAMRESLDSVAHDIRTPLTRIRNIAESALLSKETGAAIPALEECAENIGEITALLDQLLDISEAESGTIKLRLETVNVKTLAESVIDIYSFVAEEKEIKIQLIASDDVVWSLDPRRVKQIIGNLIDNAIKFSPAHTSVKITVYSDESKLRIEVKDQGTGISDDDLPRIWDRLYRGDKSRSTTGLGLGLSLVRSFVLAHSGHVEVSSSSSAGTTISAIFPKM